MSIKQALYDLLLEGRAQEFNLIADRWREENEEGYIDLSNMDLNHKTLDGFNLSHCAVAGLDLSGSMLNNCVIRDWQDPHGIVIQDFCWIDASCDVGDPEKIVLFDKNRGRN